LHLKAKDKLNACNLKVINTSWILIKLPFDLTNTDDDILTINYELIKENGIQNSGIRKIDSDLKSEGSLILITVRSGLVIPMTSAFEGFNRSLKNFPVEQ